jgi:4-hydroxy-2-oxoheptanedioate aldolase
MKQRWSTGDAGVGLWLTVPDSSIAEHLGTLDPAYLVVDMQHGVIDYSDVRHLFQAIQRSAATPLIRVPWNEPGIIGKVLDAGALGVIIPMVNTVEEAERAVASCFYQPKGSRSHGPVRAGIAHGDGYATEANDQVACIVMIETVQAITNIDDILAVPGIDAVYVGPADLSRTLGLAPQGDHDDPSFVEAIDTILAACANAGVAPGIHANPALIEKRLSQGFQMVTATSDLLAVMAGARAALAGDGDSNLY